MQNNIDTNSQLHLIVDDIKKMVEELHRYHSIYAPFFYRREQRECSEKYLMGLMLNIPRKSIEPMVLEMQGNDQNAVRSMQQFISEGKWSVTPIIHRHWMEVEKMLGCDDGVLIIDGSDFPKSGQNSAGVKRQHCGQLGKTANCQAGVFVAFAGDKGYTLVDSRLYLPREWVEDEEFKERREKCNIPEDTVFKTKNELAADMITEIIDVGTLQARWLTADEAFGRDTVLLDIIEDKGLFYFAEVPLDTHVWLERQSVEIPCWSGHGRKPTRPKLCVGGQASVTVSDIASSLQTDDWQYSTIKEGSKGPIKANIAVIRVVAVRNGLPGPDVWLVFRHNIVTNELKAYLSNAPSDTSFKKFVWLTGMRWPVEMCFEDSKQLLGMGDYEVRSWIGWYHHMTLCMLAHFFLVSTCITLKKKFPDITLYQTHYLFKRLLEQSIAPSDLIYHTLLIMGYHQRRNLAAYLSHRKKRLLLLLA